MALSEWINKLLGFVGLRMLRQESYDKLLRVANLNLIRETDVSYLLRLQNLVAPESLRLALQNSKAQIRQDVHALVLSGFKIGGYFVEFGAGNGRDGSNTYLLEKEFGWTGILSEPARCWHADLDSSRTCTIDKRCVWRETGTTMAFREAYGGFESAIIETANDVKGHVDVARTYDVRTVSLSDLLREHKAPKDIDFLSIDTEGSELEILKAFEFDQYKFRFIVCEHNRALIRDDIRKLLFQNNYQLLETEFTFEDWFVPVRD